MAPSHLDLAVDLARLLEEIDVPYVIGGSVASSLVGEPRSTIDIDIAVDLNDQGLEVLVRRVRPTFYVPETDAARAVREKDSFNIIHNDAALKIDFFVLGNGTLDVNQLNRRVQVKVPTEPAAHLWITSPEDQVLRKLDWYRTGGRGFRSPNARRRCDPPDQPTPTRRRLPHRNRWRCRSIRAIDSRPGYG